MTDKPILFSGPMVRAILEGRKSMTRRVITPQPDESLPIGGACQFDETTWVWQNGFDGSIVAEFEKNPPYSPGDRLYVREAWRTLHSNDCLKPSRLADDRSKITYEADPERRNPLWAFGRLRPGLFLPRWASRLTLTVTGVKVERVQDISEEDAEAEGLRGNASGPWGREGLIEDFEALWDSLNEKRGFSWSSNPWVCAISFEVHHCNIDALPCTAGGAS